MKKFALVFVVPLLLAACNRDPYQVENPDPNHIHADFAVWVGGQQIDFSSSEYMSGLSTDDTTHDESGEYLHEHLHLHDNVGTVIHSHKPGQTFGEFMESLGVRLEKNVLVPEATPPLNTACLILPDEQRLCAFDRQWHVIVNGKPFGCSSINREWLCSDSEVQQADPHRALIDIWDYQFQDLDQILLSYQWFWNDQEIKREWEKLTDDACLYSKRCPWRGEPPAENCVADPAVPCVAPLD